jgi:GTPase SAR1 family protein
MESRVTRHEFEDFLLRMAGVFQSFPELRDHEASLREIATSVISPFTLAVFGRMKTGKSSIINALVGRQLAITGVEEATATLNWISYGTNEQSESVIVHWKDGRVEPIPFSRISEWAGKDPKVLKRVRETEYLQMFADAETLRNINIVDTPGTGSAAYEHEEVAKQFLSPRAAEESEDEGRKADALLYVFPPVARASDEDSLGTYRQTRMPGSDPYNSIGVLHKWDGMEAEDLEAEAESKSARVAATLSDMVCEVIPVSAPLALAARNAPGPFFDALLELTCRESARDDLFKALKRDNRWDQDEGRKRIRESYPMPWVSFVRLVRLLIDRSCQSATGSRSACLDASGFARLEIALNERFFQRAALIKQRLTRVKAKRPIQLGLMKLNDRLESLVSDQEHLSDLIACATPQSRHHGQVAAGKGGAREIGGTCHFCRSVMDY